MASDGSVVIEVDAKTDKAEKKLSKLQSDIEKTESELRLRREGRVPLANELNEAMKVAGEASLEIENMKKSLAEAQAAFDPKKTQGFDIPFDKFLEYREIIDTFPQKIAKQEEEYEKLNKQAERLAEKVSKYDNGIKAAENELRNQKEEAGKIVQEIDQTRAAQREVAAKTTEVSDKMGTAADNSERMEDGISRADSFLDKLGKRISGLAKRVFIFSLITAALREMRTWISKVIKTNDEANAAFSRLKGALLSLAQPLVEVIIPALTTLANILTVIITQIARLLSGLSGKTAEQSANAAKELYEETEALEGVGGAAEEAAGSLAGFDEINILQTKNAAGGGAAAAAEAAAEAAQMPNFTLDSNISDRLKEIADLVMLIAAGLALWKIGAMLPGVLGTVATILAGILVTVGGLLLAWHGLSDAWENGVSWGNLIESIGGVAAAMLGLYLLFGPIGAGIGGIVGGIALLVTAFHDAMENGWNLQNTLMAIAGLLAAGLGISLLTGSWIPLLIAGIASLLLAFTNATGHGGELLNGIKQIIEGFKDFFVGIFTGDIEKAIGGIEKIVDGLKTAIFAVVDGVKDTFDSFLTWLDEKTGGKLHGIIEVVRGLFNGLFEFVETTLGGLLDTLEQILTGLVEFVSGVFTGDWDKAWQGIKDIFKGVWNGVIGFLESAVNLIIDGVNWLIKQMNKISFDVPSWVPGIGGKSIGVNIPSISTVSLPRLAQGAVIPPNREFLAVLGDQKSGTNIEAPTAEIENAVARAMQRAGVGGQVQVNVTFNGSLAQLARVLQPYITAETNRRGPQIVSGGMQG